MEDEDDKSIYKLITISEFADEILNHINKNKVPDNFIRKLTQYPMAIRINLEYISIPRISNSNERYLYPGINIFNMATKNAFENHGRNVTKNEILLILCQLIDQFFRESLVPDKPYSPPAGRNNLRNLCRALRQS